MYAGMCVYVVGVWVIVIMPNEGTIATQKIFLTITRWMENEIRCHSLNTTLEKTSPELLLDSNKV